MNDITEELSNVSRETRAALEFLCAEVRRWNSTINLVSTASLDHLMERHVLDSAQLLNGAPMKSEHWADLGSGAGFPGLVVAVLAKDLGYPRSVSLIEADSRKSVFLREIVRQLRLTVDVVNQRIEAVPRLNANVLSARALAPLANLCTYAAQHLAQDGIAIFPKGKNYLLEIEEARAVWKFDLDIVPSATAEGAAILYLSDIRHV